MVMNKILLRCTVLGGVLVGFSAFVGSLVLLGWNENRALNSAQTIDYARDEFVQLDSCVPSSVNDGKLVAITGCGPAPEDGYLPTSEEYLTGVSTDIKSNLTTSTTPLYSWSRSTQQYVSVESYSSGTDSDGSSIDDYEYVPRWWSSRPKYAQKGKASPPWWPSGWESTTGIAPVICIGVEDVGNCSNTDTSAFLLRSSNSFQSGLMKNVGSVEDLVVAEDAYAVTNTYATAATKCVVDTTGSVLQTQFAGLGCASPRIGGSGVVGDFRWSWKQHVHKAGDRVSVLAKQVRNSDSTTTFELWQDSRHSGCSYCTIGHLENSVMTGDEILDKLAPGNKRTWILRIVGWLLCWFGLLLVVAPVTLAPEIVPCIGYMIEGIIGALLCLLTCVMATAFSILVIAIVWLTYRPMVGIPLLCGSIAGIAGSVFLIWKNRKYRNKLGAELPLSDAGAGVQSYSLASSGSV